MPDFTLMCTLLSRYFTLNTKVLFTVQPWKRLVLICRSVKGRIPNSNESENEECEESVISVH